MLGQLRTVVTVCTLHSGYGYVQHTIYTWLQKYEYKYCTFDGYVVDVSDLIIFHSFSLRDMSTLTTIHHYALASSYSLIYS